jgi:hypothetical protein
MRACFFSSAFIGVIRGYSLSRELFRFVVVTGHGGLNSELMGGATANRSEEYPAPNPQPTTD